LKKDKILVFAFFFAGVLAGVFASAPFFPLVLCLATTGTFAFEVGRGVNGFVEL
jgi:hypothetical protein